MELCYIIYFAIYIPTLQFNNTMGMSHLKIKIKSLYILDLIDARTSKLGTTFLNCWSSRIARVSESEL